MTNWKLLSDIKSRQFNKQSNKTHSQGFQYNYFRYYKQVPSNNKCSLLFFLQRYFSLMFTSGRRHSFSPKSVLFNFAMQRLSLSFRNLKQFTFIFLHFLNQKPSKTKCTFSSYFCSRFNIWLPITQNLTRLRKNAIHSVDVHNKT